jgi:uncharacterized repeat protein (TIGR02543 family)
VANDASLDKVTALLPGETGYDVATSLAGRLDNPNANLVKIFTDNDFNNEWAWILMHLKSMRVDKADYLQDLIDKTATSSDSAIKYELVAFLGESHRSGWPTSTDYTIPANANAFWDDMPTVEPVGTYTEGQEHVLEVPVKEGFTFKGWYDNLEFIGTPITKITTIDTGNLTLYARWEQIIVPEDITKAVADDIDEVEFDLATINLDLEVVQDPVDKTKAKISGNLVVEVFAEDTVKGFGKVSDLIPVGATSDRYALVAWNIGLETHIWIIGNTTESFVVVRNEIEYTFDVSDLVWPVEEELLYSIDFEGGKQNSYLRNVDTTLGVEGGLNWHIATETESQSGVLWNYAANQDTNLTPEQGLNIARLDGRNETTITSDAISNVTKLVFDAKFYGTRTDSNLKVQIKVGDGEFVDAFTVNLASTFNTFTVNINEENVQIRFVATGERSNLDNIRIYG